MVFHTTYVGTGQPDCLPCPRLLAALFHPGARFPGICCVTPFAAAPLRRSSVPHDLFSPEALADALAARHRCQAPWRACSAQRLPSGQPRKLEPLADAIARGASIRERLIRDAGGLLTAPQMAAALGISRQAVDKRRRAGRLLAVRAGADWRYPAIQVNPDGTVPDTLATVLERMSNSSPWTTSISFWRRTMRSTGSRLCMPSVAAARRRGGFFELMAAGGADAYS